jgi:hypothetical protein
MLTIVVTALATLIVTVVAGVVLDYVRRGRPKIAYAVKDAVPIDLGGKRVGAYLVSVANISKPVVEDVTCHIQAQPAQLRNGGITAPQGLQYTVTDAENGLQIAIPYLKKGDELQATIIAEAAAHVPTTPDVAIRSPKPLSVVLNRPGLEAKGFRGGFLTAALVGALASGIGVGLSQLSPGGGLVSSQNDVLCFAASVAGLPNLSDRYATSLHVNFYNQGDLAYALAAASSDHTEIEKYRKFIDLVLQSGRRMLPHSRAKFLYSRGKIDLLLGDKERAVQDFTEALARHRSTVEASLKMDAAVHEFLVAHAVH